MSQPERRVVADAGVLAARLADALVAEADAAIAARGVFHLVLAGGTSARAMYRVLAERDAGDSRWQVWYGDERCLPAGDAERNNTMVEAAWLSTARIPPENRRPIPAERGADDAAAAYARWLEGVPDFDLVLLGMGEDGHTASLFPGRDPGKDWGCAPGSPDVLAVHDAPKPPPERVSLSASRLNRSRRVWFVISGAGKRDALSKWGDKMLPVSLIAGQQQTLVWADAAASPAAE